MACKRVQSPVLSDRLEVASLSLTCDIGPMTDVADLLDA